MRKFVEVEPICPFLDKPCIKNGLEWDRKIVHPCAFWDEYPYNGIDPEEPCRIKRAVNRILSDEVKANPDDIEIQVPWDETPKKTKRSGNNVRKAKKCNDDPNRND